ncbi:DUF397 domain-containing protein [Streptomyces netropsis]|uniref:DUF397 domain-containing protein n=1 Tax=Streptomyces netropsis TaxID=55404 RepID=A0A7W7PE88_STRNE|nr:DUF397 domain-containing protein [Streptomyces netropsis]MBB4886804.1 hypothetical protein [Streptomyces netropsis]GGR23255.1 hypothetical protein GCM10010219_29970 [Streptomyces netropsis]
MIPAVDLRCALWFKSTYSGTDSNCVEVAHAPGVIGVRDSKNPCGPVLVFGPVAWKAFLAGGEVAKNGVHQSR